MTNASRAKLENWAVSYAKNPNIPLSSPSKAEALAIKIHTLMSDQEWRTTKEIATLLQEPLYKVIDVLKCIRPYWDYETSKSKTKGGYRRLTCVE